jgi:site-specific recombinase XerD
MMRIQEEAQTITTSDLATLVEDYLLACRAKGLARSTIKQSYGYPLHDYFLPWCAARDIATVSGLTTRQMNAFAAQLGEEPGKRGKLLAKDSVHSYMRGVRGFLHWCEAEKEGKPALPPLPRLPRRLLDVLDRDEIDTLEAGARTERDRLLIRILADCGLRAYELVSLRPEQIVRHDRQANLHVHGKGERDRFVPLPPALLRRIERYLRVGRPKDTRHDEIFLGLRRGRSHDYEPLTPSGLLQLVKTAADQADITKRVYSHLLRHSFITNCLRDGMSPLLVAKIAGHSSLKMIERIYSHLTTEDAYDAMIDMMARSERRRRGVAA